MLGILDLRSLGYYKNKQGILQQNLSKHYHFESAENYVRNLIHWSIKIKKDEKV